MPFPQRLDQGHNSRAVFSRWKSAGNLNELISHAPLGRNDNCQFIAGLTMFYKNINDTFDTLRISN